MNGKRKVTLRQVAKQADVSVGTVSNYLNGFRLRSKVWITFLICLRVR